MENDQSQGHSQSMNSPLQSALTPGKPGALLHCTGTPHAFHPLALWQPEHRAPAHSLYQEQELSVPGSCSHLSLKDQLKKETHRCHKEHAYTALFCGPPLLLAFR